MNILSFRERYSETINVLKDMLLSKTSKLYSCEFINYLGTLKQSGGNPTMFPPESVENLENMEFEYNVFDETYKDELNVIILGSGPVGLYLSIILKTIIPELKIIILEKDRGSMRKFTRGQILLCKHIISEFKNCLPGIQSILGDTMGNFLFDEKLFNLFPKKIQEYFEQQDIFDNTTGQNAIPINVLEIYLSYAVQELGINIFNMTNVLESYFSEKTLSIFDATGGRLTFNPPEWNKIGENPPKKCAIEFSKENLSGRKTANTAIINTTKYGSYKIECVPCNEENCLHVNPPEFIFQVKGYNVKDVVFFEGIPIINVGNSMISVSFTTGDGLRLGYTHAFLCALALKQIFNLPRESLGGRKRKQTKIKKHKKKSKRKRIK